MKVQYVGDINAFIESIAPSHWAFGFDKVGLQIGDSQSQVSQIVVTLDCTQDCLDFAESVSASLIVSHHPLIWEPLSSLTQEDSKSAIIRRLVKSNQSLVAAHTNWDCAPGGINDALATTLQLQYLTPFGSKSQSTCFKLVTFVPVEAVDHVRKELAEAGAGLIGHYDNCSFVSQGTGSFRGLAGSNPTIGQPGSIERVNESRIETTVDSHVLPKVVAALRSSHPYEEPAFDLLPLKCGGGNPIGRTGSLSKPMDIREFQSYVNAKLDTASLMWTQNLDSKVQRVAVVGGAGDDEWKNALDAGAEVLVTGEVKHHNAVEASAAGIALVQAGHFATEQPGVRALARMISNHVPQIMCSVFEPDQGLSGCPRHVEGTAVK